MEHFRGEYSKASKEKRHQRKKGTKGKNKAPKEKKNPPPVAIEEASVLTAEAFLMGAFSSCCLASESACLQVKARRDLPCEHGCQA